MPYIYIYAEHRFEHRLCTDAEVAYIYIYIYIYAEHTLEHRKFACESSAKAMLKVHIYIYIYAEHTLEHRQIWTFSSYVLASSMHNMCGA